MGYLSDFQRVRFVDVHSAAASSARTAILLRVSTAAVPKDMTAYTYHGKTSSAERNSGPKPKLIERDRLTLRRVASNNQRTVASKVTTELSIHLEDTVSTETI